MKRRKWWHWGIEILVVLVLVSGIHYWRTRDAASGPAPPLSAVTIGGDAFDLGTSQRPLLVHFWGTWCPICRLEEGSIDSLAREGRVVTVALSSGSDAEVLEYLRERELDFPVINDPQGSIARDWGVSGVPMTFVVDEGGEIRFRTSGYTTMPGLRARLWAAGFY